MILVGVTKGKMADLLEIEMKWVIQKIFMDQNSKGYTDIWCACFQPCACALVNIEQGLRPIMLSFCPSVHLLETLRAINTTGDGQVYIKCFDCYKELCCNAVTMDD